MADGKPLEDRVRILTIDDEEIVHASLKKILTKAGYEVDSVLSAREGIERLKQERFNLAIVDLMMPEMDGIQFLTALKSQGVKLPTLMVTGYPTITTAVQALRLGAVDYVAKPFTRKELLSPVQRALSLPEEETESFLKAGGHEAVRKEDLTPGTTLILPRHSWARFEQDGTFLVGVEKSFLALFDEIESVSLPEEMDFVEQGYIAFHLTNKAGDEHGVAMPLSGQVVAVNQQALENPSGVGSESWLVRLIPSHLNEELGRLIPKKPL